MVVMSTKQEIEEQWGLYDGFDLKVECKLCIRHIWSKWGLLHLLINPNKAKKPLPPIWSKVLSFFTNPHKPMILALSRQDPKKNITTLLKAYGENRHLRERSRRNLGRGKE
uniref:Uncharacterized protein n=1 Tax=Oryza nivara TaxID=4536 RepID=A0A0E0I1W1_ORYNI